MKSVNINGVLETCLYVRDLEKAEIFYTEVLGLDLMKKAPGRHLFFRCGPGMLLLFNPEATLKKEWKVDEDIVPSHGTSGPGHVAFSISQTDFDNWRERLQNSGVEIESEIDWPWGGHSLYFRDPCQNSLELTTPSIWKLDEQ